MPTSSKASEALAQIMTASLSKDPALADKQRRLLQVLSSPTSSDSNASTPPQLKPSEMTEADELESGGYRLFKALRQSQAFTAQSQALSPSPSNTPATTASTSSANPPTLK